MLEKARGYTEKHKVLLIWAAIILSVISYTGFRLIKAHNDRAYWAELNSVTEFKGNEYSIRFPCSPVESTDMSDVSDSNLKVSERSCTTYTGKNHSEIDIYQVRTETYLTNKYNPQKFYICRSGTDFEGKDYHVIYNETRERDGYQINICGYENSLTAKVLQGNKIFIISVIPSDEKTQFPKLSSFVDSFVPNY